MNVVTSENQGTVSRTSETRDLAALLTRFRDAARGKRAPTYEERVAHLDRLEQTLLRRREAIADAVSKDFGSRSRHETLVTEVFVTLNEIRFARSHLREWMEPRSREVHWAFLPATAEVQYQPLGVVGIISPWNYPIQLAFAPLVAALAAGNRAIIKPSEFVPATAALMADMVAETFDPDHVTVVTGGPDVGEAFSKLPFDHLFFTGSTRLGRIVMRAAAENLVPVTLELGGKSPTIVAADYSIELAAQRIAMGKCLNSGQTCVAPDYVMVPESKRDAFVDAMKAAVAKMYPTLEKNSDYTAVINDRHYDRLKGYVKEAVEAGAKAIEINPASETLDPANRKFPLTLLLDTKETSPVRQEEIFGPLLPIVTYRDISDAIRYVNDQPRPLALYIFTNDKSVTERVLAETISGGVTVNDCVLHVAQDDLPFGGVGPSGMGHYHGFEGFEQLSKKKPIFYQSRLSATALLGAPYGKVADTLLKFLIGW